MSSLDNCYLFYEFLRVFLNKMIEIEYYLMCFFCYDDCISLLVFMVYIFFRVNEFVRYCMDFVFFRLLFVFLYL